LGQISKLYAEKRRRIVAMDEKEYKKKYFNLRVLKSVQEYLRQDSTSPTAVYPIRVPDDLLYQVLKLQGPEKIDKLIHHIFKVGLNIWSEQLYNDVFGSEENLEEFIELVKKRSKESK
jgi:hypothetical protein